MLHALRSSCDRIKRFLTNEPTLTECLDYFVLVTKNLRKRSSFHKEKERNIVHELPPLPT